MLYNDSRLCMHMNKIHVYELGRCDMCILLSMYLKNTYGVFRLKSWSFGVRVTISITSVSVILSI